MIYTKIRSISPGNTFSLKLIILSIKHLLSRTHNTSEDQMFQQWRGKQLQGGFYRVLQDQDIVIKTSLGWLTQGYLMPQTEGFMTAIQDQIIKTRNYQKFILNEEMESDSCRKCYKFPENIEHLISGWEILANTHYIDRHNQLAKIINIELLKMCGLIKDDDDSSFTTKSSGRKC